MHWQTKVIIGSVIWIIILGGYASVMWTHIENDAVNPNETLTQNERRNKLAESVGVLVPIGIVALWKILEKPDKDKS